MIDRVCRHGLGLMLGLFMIGVTPWVEAHHANSMFDMQKRHVMRGTVEKLKWINPHGWLYVNVDKQNGKSELWGFELGSPNSLMRTGWNPSGIKVGDKVTLVSSIARDGTRVGILVKVTLPNGRELEGIPVPEGQVVPGGGPQSATAKIPTSEYK